MEQKLSKLTNMPFSQYVMSGIVFDQFNCSETENIDKTLTFLAIPDVNIVIRCQFLLSLISELALPVGHKQHLRAKQEEKETCFGGTILFNVSMGVRGHR